MSFHFINMAAESVVLFLDGVNNSVSIEVHLMTVGLENKRERKDVRLEMKST